MTAEPDATWVEGEGWNYAAIPGGRPTAAMLEGVAGGRPAFLFSYDVHTVWLNREAMAVFAIDRHTERLAWGTIERDASGEPTGYIHDFAVLGISEDGERDLRRHVPGYGVDTAYERLVESLDMATRLGITTIVEPQNGLDDLELFARARAEGDLRSRLVAAMLCLPETTSERLDALEAARARFDDDRLRVQAVKLYIDDVIEPHTAAMLAPYANAPATSGDTFWDPDAYGAFVVELERRGWQAFTHATGDRGIRVALDAVARARAELGPADARHQLVHVECVHPDDVPRFGELGVVACMQPRHCAPDIVEEWRANVGARARAVRVAVPVDRRDGRRARVQLGLERRRDGPDGLALHRVHARRARRDRRVEPRREGGPGDRAPGLDVGERVVDPCRGRARHADARHDRRRGRAVARPRVGRSRRQSSTPT